jgi:hypothetical protein
VVLPRSFKGPISATTHNGSVRLSPALRSQQTPFSDVEHTSRFFIGDITEYAPQEGKNWLGDELVIGSKNGGIRILYIDEVTVADFSMRSLFSRIFDSIL